MKMVDQPDVDGFPFEIFDCLNLSTFTTPSSGPDIKTQQIEPWRKDNCTKKINDYVFSRDGGEGGFNKDRFTKVQNSLNTQILLNYTCPTDSEVGPNCQGFAITDKGKTGYTEFQEDIYELCTTIPGVCDPWLSGQCSTVTVTQMQASPALLEFCGCRVEYDPYNTGDPAQCYPFCTLQTTIPLGDPDTGNAVQCDEPRCIINGVTIGTIGGSNVNNVTFSQLCGACIANQGQGCQCFIDNSSGNIPQSATSGCSGNSVCISSTGQQTQCSNVTPTPPTPPQNNKKLIDIFIVIFFIIFILVILFALFL
jgi:Family of unknown function (DUF5857)